MCVGKTHPFGGKPVDGWSGNFGIWVVTTGVTQAHVIGQNNNDVGRSNHLGIFAAAEAQH
jgi:hypothetical protein